ncbi:MAG TPA: PHB depolymerase family esterase [Bryobacteraceae bacterium]|nr:PHB depolymerase family esterase [Bryobacteraceae bacterium]
MVKTSITRRKFSATTAAASGLILAPAVQMLRAQSTDRTRLSARPDASAPRSAMPGLRPVGLRSQRDALLYVPESSAKFEQAPLFISLHGATRNADRGIEPFRSLADKHGFLLLAPASEDHSWDALEGDFGADVAFISQCMARIYEQRRIDPARIAMAGFSDGATYALSLGLANGDLFNAVFGFSPGFVVPAERIGKPPVFISHGTIDPVLPIEQCSRVIVPQLERLGYRVTYREFEGKHTLPPEIAADALSWFMERRSMQGTPSKA